MLSLLFSKAIIGKGKCTSDSVADCVWMFSNSDTVFCQKPAVGPAGSSSYHYRREISIREVPVSLPKFLLEECFVRPLTLRCLSFGKSSPC